MPEAQLQRRAPVTMAEAHFMVGGTGVARVGKEAEALHDNFVGVIECPQRGFRQLDGRRLFLVQYSNIEPQEVEVIRQGLVQRCGSRAWSITTDADGTATFHPKLEGGPRELPRRRHEREEESFPSWHSELSDDWYEDDSDSDSDWDSDSDCDWDYRGPRYPYPNDRGHGRRYDDYPEPSTHRSRRSNTYPLNDDYPHRHGHAQHDYPDRSRRSNTFPTNHDYAHGHGPPHNDYPNRTRRSSTFPMNHDYAHPHPHPHDDYPDPLRHHNLRSNSFATDYDPRQNHNDYSHPHPYSNRRPTPHPAPYDRRHGHGDYGYPPRPTYPTTHHHGHRPAYIPTHPPHPHHHRQPGSPFPSPRHGHGHRFPPSPSPYAYPNDPRLALTTLPRPRRRGRLTRKIWGMIRSFVNSWT